MKNITKLFPNSFSVICQIKMTMEMQVLESVSIGTGYMCKVSFGHFNMKVDLTNKNFMYLVTSKEFWSQVERSKIYKLAAQFAYKHDFEMFDYSIEEYLKRIDLGI